MSAPVESRDITIYRWLAALVFVLGCLFIFDANDGNTDAEVHFQQIRAMAERGSLAFEPDNNVTRLIIQMESGPGSAGAASQKGVDGRVYGHFGIYYVLLGVPFYYAGSFLNLLFPSTASAVEGSPFLLNSVGQLSHYWQRLAVTVISPFFLAIAAASIYMISRRLGAARAAALLIALAYAFGTFAGVQARHCGSDNVAAGLLALTFERVLAASTAGRRAFVHAGIAAGLLFGSRYLALAVLPGVLVAAAFVAWSRTWTFRDRLNDVGAMAAPFVILSSVILYFNAIRWGSPLDFGYVHSFVHDHVLTFSLLEAAPRGLLLSFFAPSRGLVYFALPLVLPGFAGIALLFIKNPRIALVLLIGVAATVIPPSLSIIWNGTWSFGPRYHLSSLIYFAPAAAMLLDAAFARGRAWFAVAAFPVIAGFILIFPALVTSPFSFLKIASDALRIEKPPSSYENPLYRNSPELVEADHQEFLPVAPFSSPYNAIAGQWRVLAMAIRGEYTFPVRTFFNIPQDTVLTAGIPEHLPRRSPWWATLSLRSGSRAPYYAAAALAFAALFAFVKLYYHFSRSERVSRREQPAAAK